LGITSLNASAHVYNTLLLSSGALDWLVFDFPTYSGQNGGARRRTELVEVRGPATLTHQIATVSIFPRRAFSCMLRTEWDGFYYSQPWFSCTI